MTQDDIWEKHYQEVMGFITEKKKRPSKHNAEDRGMLNWLKYNKKRLAKGQMPPDRAKKFAELCQQSDKYRRLNQYSYKVPTETTDGEMALFSD